MYQYSEDNKYVISRMIQGDKGQELIEYYPNTLKEEAQKHRKFKNIIIDGFLVRSFEYADESQELIARYQYEDKTKFDNRAKKLKLLYRLKNNYLVSAQAYEPNSEQISALYEYEEKCPFDKRADKLKSIKRLKNGLLVSEEIICRKPHPRKITTFFKPLTIDSDEKRLITKVVEKNMDNTINKISIYDKNKYTLKDIFVFKKGTISKNHMKHVKGHFSFQEQYLKRIYLYDDDLNLTAVLELNPNIEYNIEQNKYYLKGEEVTLAKAIYRHYYFKDDGFIDFAYEYKKGKMEKLIFKEFSKIENKKNKVIKREPVQEDIN